MEDEKMIMLEQAKAQGNAKAQMEKTYKQAIIEDQPLQEGEPVTEQEAEQILHQTGGDPAAVPINVQKTVASWAQSLMSMEESEARDTLAQMQQDMPNMYKAVMAEIEKMQQFNMDGGMPSEGGIPEGPEVAGPPPGGSPSANAPLPEQRPPRRSQGPI